MPAVNSSNVKSVDADNAQAAIDSAMRMALSRALVQELPANDAADCARCGELIGAARKVVMPSAQLCIVCETERSESSVLVSTKDGVALVLRSTLSKLGWVEK